MRSRCSLVTAPEIVELSDDEREHVWRLIAGSVAARPPGTEPDPTAFDRQPTLVYPVESSACRRPLIATVVAAALITAVACGGVAALVSRRSRTSINPTVATTNRSSGSAATPVITEAQSTATSTDTATSTTVVAPPRLTWERAANEGSLGRSQVTGLSAGPGGFVATGMGFDDGRNQGRVWFSLDGSSWSEPALDVFDAKSMVGAPAATSQAYYVVAATNADRLPNSHEGDPAPSSSRLYRSVDGHIWSPWGDQIGSIQQIAAAGNTLLRLDMDNQLYWSSDGLSWNATVIPGHPTLVTLGDGNAFSPGIGPWYIYGERNNAPALWQSTDAKTWTEIAAPPGGGRPAATSAGLISLFDPDAQRCIDQQQTAISAEPDFHGLADTQWACAHQLSVARYDDTTDSWTTAAPAGLGQGKTFGRLGALNDVVVAPILGPDRTMTIWTADATGGPWQPDPHTTLNYTTNDGSPQPALIAVSTDRIIVVPSPTIAGNATTQTILIGQRPNP